MQLLYSLGTAAAEAEGVHGEVEPLLALSLDGLQAPPRVVLAVGPDVDYQHEPAGDAAQDAQHPVEFGHALRW